MKLQQSISISPCWTHLPGKNISAYLTSIAQGNITEEQAEEVFGMVSIVKDMESMGAIIHRNMIPLITKKRKLQFDFSSEGKEELLIYHGKVSKQIRLLKEAFKETNPKLAKQIMKKERKYLDLESKYRANHLKRVILKEEASVETTEIHMELMDLMKQIVLYSANIAQTYINTTTEEGVEHININHNMSYIFFYIQVQQLILMKRAGVSSKFYRCRLGF
jgi:phosphate:Na+ symporter